jgi:hypothetical protein
MKACPILFSGEMVRAILMGRKTQTRWIVKNYPTRRAVLGIEEVSPGLWRWEGDRPTNYDGDVQMNDWSYTQKCPFGAKGTRLWVRENWRSSLSNDDRKPNKLPCGAPIYYEAACPDWQGRHSFIGKLRPSIHMPRWACRLVLEVTDVRAERLNEISLDGAAAEAPPSCDTQKSFGDYIDCFRHLWDSLNAKRGFGWSVNPWVWVVTFRRVEP